MNPVDLFVAHIQMMAVEDRQINGSQRIPTLLGSAPTTPVTPSKIVTISSVLKAKPKLHSTQIKYCVDTFPIAKSITSIKDLKAIIKIQAVVRGFLQRLEYRLLCLEKKLQDVEERKQRALNTIERRKVTKIKDMKKLKDAKATNRTTKLLYSARDLISLLHRQKQRFTSELSLLDIECKKVRIMNQQLEQCYSYDCRSLVRQELELIVLADQNAVLNAVLRDLLENVELVKRQLVECSKQNVLDEMLQKRRMQEGLHSIDGLVQNQLDTLDCFVEESIS